MSATYDLNTPVGQVRCLIPDADIKNALFSDEELTFFLTQADADIYYAAYIAVHIIIRDKARLSLKVKREGYESSSHAIKELLGVAESIKQQQFAVTRVETGNIELTDEYIENFRPLWRDALTREWY